jgi:excisionase family DNA binding protein
MAKTNNKPLTVSEAALLLGIKNKDVYNWLYAGKITGYKSKRSGRLYFDPEELKESQAKVFHKPRTKILSFRLRLDWHEPVRKVVAAERERLEAASTGAATIEATPKKGDPNMPP